MGDDTNSQIQLLSLLSKNKEAIENIMKTTEPVEVCGIKIYEVFFANTKMLLCFEKILPEGALEVILSKYPQTTLIFL